jgi:hypothetical protein
MSASNSFGTFLETRELMRKGAGGRPSTPSDPNSRAAASLRMLTEQTFPVPLRDLFASSEMQEAEFVEAVGALCDADLIEVREENSEEVVVLTERGEAFKAA